MKTFSMLFVAALCSSFIYKPLIAGDSKVVSSNQANPSGRTQLDGETEVTTSLNSTKAIATTACRLCSTMRCNNVPMPEIFVTLLSSQSAS